MQVIRKSLLSSNSASLVSRKLVSSANTSMRIAADHCFHVRVFALCYRCISCLRSIGEEHISIPALAWILRICRYFRMAALSTDVIADKIALRSGAKRDVQRISRSPSKFTFIQSEGTCMMFLLLLRCSR